MKPYFKKSHNAYYVNIKGKQIRLGKTLEEATAKLPKNDLHSLTKLWLDHYENDRTRRSNAAHLKPFLKHVDVTATRLKPYHLTRVLENYKVNYRASICKTVKACFAWLKTMGYIIEDPFASVRQAAFKPRGDVAYVFDARDVVNKTTGDLWDILTMLLDTGCRPFEARTMEAKDFHDDLIEFKAEDSKGKKHPRIIRMNQRALGIVQRRKGAFPNGPIFREGGRPWTSGTLIDACRPLGITPYQLRHTFITNALMQGTPPHKVMELVGHSSMKMINEVYQHVKLLGPELQEAVEKINA